MTIKKSSHDDCGLHHIFRDPIFNDDEVDVSTRAAPIHLANRAEPITNVNVKIEFNRKQICDDPSACLPTCLFVLFIHVLPLFKSESFKIWNSR